LGGTDSVGDTLLPRPDQLSTFDKRMSDELLSDTELLPKPRVEMTAHSSGLPGMVLSSARGARPKQSGRVVLTNQGAWPPRGEVMAIHLSGQGLNVADRRWH
jgi:hypothetical protein